MMKIRFFPVLFLFSISLLLAGCGGKYSDCVDANNRFTALINDYVASLDKSENAKEVAAAMNEFAEGLEVLGPEIKALTKKYPELKDNSVELPEALKVSQKESEEAGKKLAGAFMKTMPYMMDGDVQAAQKRVAKAMQTMM